MHPDKVYAVLPLVAGDGAVVDVRGGDALAARRLGEVAAKDVYVGEEADVVRLRGRAARDLVTGVRAPASP